MTIGMRAEVMKLFFDREAVMKQVRADQRRYFAKAGGFARTTARQSIRDARKFKKIESKGMSPEEFTGALREARYERSSKPGQPPRSRSHLLRRNIFFAFDPPRGVIAGPVKLSGKGKIPKVLEVGGQTRNRERSFEIKARPYMAPALRKTVPQLPRLYAESVRR